MKRRVADQQVQQPEREDGRMSYIIINKIPHLDNIG